MTCRDDATGKGFTIARGHPDALTGPTTTHEGPRRDDPPRALVRPASPDAHALRGAR